MRSIPRHYLCLVFAVPFLCGSFLGAQGSSLAHVDYRVHLDIDPGKKEITGRETIRYTMAQAGQEVQLNAQEITVFELRANRAISRWGQDKDHILIHLQHPLASHRVLKIQVRYGGQPRNGLTWEGGGAQALYDTPHWMVCEMKPASLATFELEARFPASMRMAASGILVRERERDGKRISLWRQKAPVPPFVLGFVVGNFQEASMVAEGLQLRFLSERHTPEQMRTIFARTPDAVHFFTERSGVALEPAVYTQALVSGSPMQELAQMTALPLDYGDTLLGPDTKDVALMAHELAHQWWGIRVPCADWDDFWLNEGMANFMTDAFLEHEFGAEAYRQAIEIHRKIYLKGKAKGKDHALCLHGWKQPSDASGWVAYHKGAYVLSLLRETMGDEAFWRGLRKYTRDHLGRPVTSKDLQTEMEKSCGCSLQAFFDQWVYA